MFQEARGNVTTGVTRRSLTGVDGELAGKDTTWPATQVGLRTVKSGLGGHDDGASGDDEGSKSNRYRYRNGDEGVSDSATFSGFVGADNHFVSENQSCLNETKS